MGNAGGTAAKVASRAEWLTRRQVARIMGVDELRVAAMDGRELHPSRRADRSWVYEPNEVAAVLIGGTTSGTVTARVFTLLRDGKSLRDIVIETLQPARRIQELCAEHDELERSITLEWAVVDELKTIFGASAVKDGKALLASVRAALDAKFRAGFIEGRADVEDYGEVINPVTGERRKVTRS
jgi:hypothetical protein